MPRARGVVDPVFLTDRPTGEPIRERSVDVHSRSLESGGALPRGVAGAITAASYGFGNPTAGSVGPDWPLVPVQAGDVITANVFLNPDGTPKGCCG